MINPFLMLSIAPVSKAVLHLSAQNGPRADILCVGLFVVFGLVFAWMFWQERNRVRS